MASTFKALEKRGSPFLLLLDFMYPPPHTPLTSLSLSLSLLSLSLSLLSATETSELAQTSANIPRYTHGGYVNVHTSSITCLQAHRKKRTSPKENHPPSNNYAQQPISLATLIVGAQSLKHGCAYVLFPQQVRAALRESRWQSPSSTCERC